MTLQSSRQALLVAAAALVAASASLGGIYMRPDIEDVPVARLVANLEKELAADPKNPDIHLRLARLYAVAYSANTTELPVTVLAGADRKPRQEVWFGHEPDLIPQKVDPGATRSEASKGFLAKSVDHYRTVVELNPSGLVGRIGYAWTLEQSGNTSGAVAEYRRVVEQAWTKEEKAKFAEPGQRFFTEEAARQLIPLLDPKRDATEIATLRARAERLGRVPRAITPIAIPLTDTASAEDHRRSRRKRSLRCRRHGAAKGVDVDLPRCSVARVRRDGQRTHHLRLAALWQRHVLERLGQRLRAAESAG